ncbi:adenylate/guanylate cyclase domain-containing protein [Myxococcota bacterium]
MAQICAKGVDSSTVQLESPTLLEVSAGQEKRRIPVNERGTARVNYPASSDAFTIQSVLEVLSGYKEARENNELDSFLVSYRDRIILVGQMASSFGDHGPTPFAQSAPLLLVHASFLDNLLSNEFLEKMPPLGNTIILVVLGLVVAVLSSRPGWVWALAAVAPILAYVAIALVLFSWTSIWADMFAPCVTAVLTLAAVRVYSVWHRDVEERYLREAFGRFAAPEIVERILADPAHLEIGGHKRNVTLLFSDIKGYTSLSNTRTPQEVMQLLKRYLDHMSRIILKHEGTIDKIMGDGIMCFFGDPIPCKDHAHRAAQAAVDMQETMTQLQNQWSKEGLPHLQIRVGIATGEVFVGNIGTDKHIEYTAIGPSVNLASRLESNADPGGILVCRDTAPLISREYECTELDDPLQLKGYAEGYRAYRLLGRREDTSQVTWHADAEG